MDYKKKNVWCTNDIETFLKAMFETPKNFYSIGKKLPHKNCKELYFFY